MAPQQQTPAPMPGRSYYGFILYIFGWSGIFFYIIWALVPHEFLFALGITYLPHQYWALALPSIIVCGVLTFITLVYPGLNMLLTVPPHDIRNLYDPHTIKKERYVGNVDSDEEGALDGLSPRVPPVYDLDISEVCQMLYADK